MKKKHRDIVVNEEQYAWLVKEADDVKIIRIFKDKKVIVEESFDGDMTPSIVEAMIENYIWDNLE